MFIFHLFHSFCSSYRKWAHIETCVQVDIQCNVEVAHPYRIVILNHYFVQLSGVVEPAAPPVVPNLSVVANRLWIQSETKIIFWS